MAGTGGKISGRADEGAMNTGRRPMSLPPDEKSLAGVELLLGEMRAVSPWVRFDSQLTCRGWPRLEMVGGKFSDHQRQHFASPGAPAWGGQSG